MLNDKISIVVPVYKTEQYLERCVNSVMNQTYQNIEIILVDDGSPDNAGKICDELQQQNDRIKVIHKSNGGVSSARNAGIQAATGKYIGFVDSDDWIEPDMFESMLRIAQKYEIDIVRCGIRRDSIFQFEEKSGIESIEIASLSDAAKSVWENGFLCNKLFHSQLFKSDPEIRFDERISYVEDEPVLLKCIVRSGRMAVIPKIGYHYYENPESASGIGFNIGRLSSLIGFKEMCHVVEGAIPDLLDYFQSKYFSICIGFYRCKETRNSVSHKKMLQEELRSNLFRILKLHNMTSKFKAAALIYCLI